MPVLLYGAWCVRFPLSGASPIWLSPPLPPPHMYVCVQADHTPQSDQPLKIKPKKRSNDKPLAEVRRGTSYFKGLTLDQQLPSADFGPTGVDPRRGVMCCGAVPYVQNYNIRLRTGDRCVWMDVLVGCFPPSCQSKEGQGGPNDVFLFLFLVGGGGLLKHLTPPHHTLPRHKTHHTTGRWPRR